MKSNPVTGSKCGYLTKMRLFYLYLNRILYEIILTVVIVNIYVKYIRYVFGENEQFLENASNLTYLI